MAKKSKKSKKKQKDEEIDMVDIEEPQDPHEQTSQELAEEEYQSNKKAFKHSLWSTIWIGLALATIGFNIFAFSVHIYCSTSKADQRSFCDGTPGDGNTVVMIIALVVAVFVSLIVIYFQFQLEDTECKLFLFL